MNRRDFLHLAGLSGLSLLVPNPTRKGWAAPPSDKEPHFWVFVHAGGGWDPTLLCDPKGMQGKGDLNPIDHYDTADIAQYGNLRCAPIQSISNFFAKRYQQMLVINGIDAQTNSHDAGTRFMWSGHLSEGWPSLAALIAAQQAPDKSLAFVSYGGYDATAGVAPVTRLGSPQTFAALAAPERIDPNKPEMYQTSATFGRIEAAQQARLLAAQKRNAAPRAIDNGAKLYALRAGDSDLGKLVKNLPANLSNDNLQRQAQMVVAAFKSGLAVSANLSRGGFDTHGNHDAEHIPALENLINGVDFLLDEADKAGIGGQLTVVVGSDFSRTPYYNAGQGKDHWSVASCLLFGKGIAGNRVIGETTADFKAKPLDPKTLQPGSGSKLTHGSVHRSLRQLAGLEGTAWAARFPIGEALVGLLG